MAKTSSVRHYKRGFSSPVLKSGTFPDSYTYNTSSSWAVSTLVRVVRDLNVYMDGRIPPADVLDSYTLSLELVHRDMLAQQILEEEDGVDYDSICDLLSRGLRVIHYLKQMEDNVHHGQFTPPVVSGRFGRPQVDITYEQLSYLLSGEPVHCSPNSRYVGCV